MNQRQVRTAIVSIPSADIFIHPIGEDEEDLSQEILNASRVSLNEISYPIIQEMHESGYETVPGHKFNQETGYKYELGLKREILEDIEPQSISQEVVGYPELLFRRRSSRNFIKETMKNEHLLTLLDILCTNDSPDHEREDRYLYSISSIMKI